MNIRPEHRKTFPTARIAETLMMFIQLRSGAGRAVNSEAVYAPLADYYELSEQERTLRASDYYAGNIKSGLAWHGAVNAAARDLIKEGYLVAENSSKKPVWRLTAKGVDRADFWIVRMTAKTAALRVLDVGTDLEVAAAEPDRSQSIDQTKP
jgi:hypothetical protein